MTPKLYFPGYRSPFKEPSRITIRDLDRTSIPAAKLSIDSEISIRIALGTI